MKGNFDVYRKVMEFAHRYPGTIAWRLGAHCKVAGEHINSDEEVLYAFAAQKGRSAFDIISTYVVVITNKRLVVAQKRLFFGYFCYSITPEMFNDLTIEMGLIWGEVVIDTIKEVVVFSNLSRNSLFEIETVMSKYLMQKKRYYEPNLTEKERINSGEELKAMYVGI